MRKVLLTLLLSCLGLYAMGQSPTMTPRPRLIPATPAELNVPVKFQKNVAATNSAGTYSWYKNREDAALTGASNYNWYHTPMFSDSSVQVLYGNASGTTSLGYVFNQGYGEVFDPRADIYDTSGSGTISLFNTYVVDSLALPYEYHYVQEKDTITPLSQNPDGLAHDTLIFQFYSAKSGGLDTGTYGAQSNFPQSPYGRVAYNYKKNLGTSTYSPTSTFTYVMGAKDSTSTGVALIQIPVMANANTVGIPINSVNKKTGFNSDLFAYTVSYRPGFKYKLGDTVESTQTTPVPAHYHSEFQVLIGNDQPSTFKGLKTPIHNREMSLELLTNTRYNKWSGQQAGFNGQYMPGTVWLYYNQILWSYFHMYMPNEAGINQTPGDPKGYILGNVYPNPVTGGTARLDFALGNTEQVKITVYDMLGHEVSVLANGQYTPGVHSITFNTDNMKEGVYLYSINAGSFAKTLKFTVTK